MSEVNGCIVTFFMDNIDMKIVEKQREVVAKRNPKNYPHYSIHTSFRHGASMDFAWAMNGFVNKVFEGNVIEKKFSHDVIMFLDVDAIPLNQTVLERFMVAAGVEQKLIGNIQRSNHIQNDQHVFAAPSAVALSADSYVSMGMPSGLETYRSDVGEEYTYAAEKHKVNIELLMPIRFDAPPAECASWALKDGMPVYGRGTTFGNDGIEEIWHNFQSFHPGQDQVFLKKCEEELAKEL